MKNTSISGHSTAVKRILSGTCQATEAAQFFDLCGARIRDVLVLWMRRIYTRICLHSVDYCHRLVYNLMKIGLIETILYYLRNLL